MDSVVIIVKASIGTIKEQNSREIRLREQLKCCETREVAYTY